MRISKMDVQSEIHEKLVNWLDYDPSIIANEEEKLSLGSFSYIDDIGLPILFLGIKQNPDSLKDYYFVNRKKFNIRHTTGGGACHNRFFTGRFLRPKVNTLKRMRNIDNYWYGSDCGFLANVSLDDTLIYREQLRELGVDCERSYKDFEEAIYPIDCSIENIRKLSLTKVPGDLDELIDWKKSPCEVYTGCYHEVYIGCLEERWNLYILGRNNF